MAENLENTESKEDVVDTNEKPQQTTGELLSFETELQDFITQIRSIRMAFPLTSHALFLTTKKRYEKLSDFVSKASKPQQNDSDKEAAYLPLGALSQFKKLERDFRIAHASRSVISRSLIVSLITEYDNLFGKLLKLVLTIKPEILNSSEKKISFSDLLGYKSIEDARDHMLEREIYSVLYQSRKEQLQYLKQRTSCELKAAIPNWVAFIELTERRNLFVHNNGQVNAAYLDNCARENVPVNEKIGDKLNANRDYFSESYHLILQIGFILTITLWTKFEPGSHILGSLNEMAYDLIADKEYLAAQIMIEFVLQASLIKDSEQKDQLFLLLNLAQTHKWLNKEDEMNKLFDSRDWSILGDLYRFAERVLRDDFDSAARFMRTTVQSKLLTDNNLQEWPLFKEFRKSEQFIQVFEELFPDAREPIKLETITKNTTFQDQTDSISDSELFLRAQNEEDDGR